jgi:hypothetical protein
VNETILDLAKDDIGWGLPDRTGGSAGYRAESLQYALVHASIRSHLAYLLDAGELTVRFEEGRMRISKAG